MAYLYENDSNVPAIVLSDIEVGGLLDKFPYCDLCNNLENEFIYLPGIDSIYCKICADAYIKSANLSKIEKKDHQLALDAFIETLKAHGMWV